MTTSTSELQQDIKRALASVGLTKIRPEILSQCVALASSIAVSPEQMAECWEAFCMNRNMKELNETSFKSYREQLIKDCDHAGLRKALDSGAVVARPALGNNNKRDGLPAVTPPAKRLHGADGLAAAFSSSSSDRNRRISLSPDPPSAASNTSTTPTSQSYELRKGAGQVVESYRPEACPELAAAASDKKTPSCRITYNHFETNVQKPYRRLFMTIDDRAQALDKQLVHMGQEISSRFGLGLETDGDEDCAVAGLEAVGIPRQVKITNVGRICSVAHEGKLNDSSVLLEGSRDTSGGARIELDLSLIKESKASFSLFPGQIVAVEGLNTSGRKLVAERICEGAAHEPLKSDVKSLLRFHHDDSFQSGAPVTILSACGPFTTTDNLEFAPLFDLMNSVTAERPDVVILTGPFVDMDNTLVRSGQTTLQFQDGEEILVPYEAFFANKVAALIEEVFATVEDLQTQFVLVPSLEDATADWVYPQPPFADRVPGGKILGMSGAEDIAVGSLGLQNIETAGTGAVKGSRRVHCVSNPCTIQINELVVGITSTDVLFDMSREEAGNVGGKLRLPRIAQHMLQQRSYYPLFPGGPSSNLDLKQLDKCKMPCLPDLLILPSRLAKFAQPVLDSTLVVNPGRLSVGTTGGSYAIMQVNPIQRELLENAGGEEVELAHNACQRTVVEIRKI